MPVAAYRYLIRIFGRGRPRAHLVDNRGEPLCNAHLGDQWELAHSARGRLVCARCQRASGTKGLPNGRTDR